MLNNSLSLLPFIDAITVFKQNSIMGLKKEVGSTATDPKNGEKNLLFESGVVLLTNCSAALFETETE